jgi:hypothetical protein
LRSSGFSVRKSLFVLARSSRQRCGDREVVQYRLIATRSANSSAPAIHIRHRRCVGNAGDHRFIQGVPPGGQDRYNKITGPRWPTRMFGSALPVEGTDTQLLSFETSIRCLQSLQRVTVKIGS